MTFCYKFVTDKTFVRLHIIKIASHQKHVVSGGLLFVKMIFSTSGESQTICTPKTV